MYRIFASVLAMAAVMGVSALAQPAERIGPPHPRRDVVVVLPGVHPPSGLRDRLLEVLLWRGGDVIHGEAQALNNSMAAFAAWAERTPRFRADERKISGPP